MEKSGLILSPITLAPPRRKKRYAKKPLPSQVIEYLGSVSNTTNEKIFSEVKKRLAVDANEEIYLTVTSSGGPSGIAMCFYDTMRYILRPRLVTIGTGDVDSSGIIIFLSGTRRVLSPRTTLLLHLAGRQFNPNVRFTASELESMAREDRLKDIQYAQVVSEGSGILSSDDVLEMMKNNTVLSPEEALRYGLTHEILS